MNPTAAPVPIEKHVVLIGAGNAHLVFAKRWGMRPVHGVAVTLVNTATEIPYSAMVPGCIGGDYDWGDVTIDLVRLCQSVKLRFLPQRVAGLDPNRREVLFADRPPLKYDILSLGLGSLPACPADQVGAEASLTMRPMAPFVRKLEGLDESLTAEPRPFHLVIAGGGASGCELALAIHKRLGRHAGFRLTLCQAGPRLLPQFADKVAVLFEQAFRERQIAYRLNARVNAATGGSLLLENGDRIPYDAVLWATQGTPPPLIRDSGLVVDGAGFLRVHETLQSVGDAAVFGSGDCVAFDAYPDLPRNGVYAVRQGAVLYDNVISLLQDRPLRPFRPQRNYLSLLNTADQQSVLSYGRFAAKGRWARRLKDRIDRAWIEKFTRLSAMPDGADSPAESYTMRCGGCGSKISTDVLSAVLRRLEIPDDPRVLLGCSAGEDAAVHRVRPELFGNRPQQLVEVQTVDYFKAFVDDPYLFGRIAALNSVSDLYAMNARPFSALAIATLPYARGPIQEAQLFELLSGAVESLRRSGVVLTGGHTTEGSELALGFSVTGFGEEDRLFRKSNLRPGDKLVLTKPLGSGALLAAWMRGQCRAAWFEPLVAAMLTSNGPAAAIFDRAGVTACTDITGFGLTGHLLEMLDASGVSARLRAKDVPLYAGFDEVVAAGIVSSLHRDNAKLAYRVQLSAAPPAWLFDPQTSGGLLGAVRPEKVDEVLRQLGAEGYQNARVIGEILAPASQSSHLAPRDEVLTRSVSTVAGGDEPEIFVDL
jgi:selenide,water dikinase